MRHLFLKSVLCLVLPASVVLSGCGSSSSTSTDDGTTTTTVTLTGQVAVSSADASLGLAPPTVLKAATKKTIRFETIADTPLTDAAVAVVKIKADGTEEATTLTATTDASGNYTIENVPVATTGTGASTDFYYYVRVTSGDLTINSPVAATADATANVSPETNIAAKMISDVVSVPGADSAPPPSADIINGSRDLVTKNTDDLSGSTTVPSVADSSGTLAIANGLAAAGGDAEKMFKAYQFDAEKLAVTASTTADATDAGAYLKKLAREGCGQDQNLNPLPSVVADALGQAILDGVTFTPSDVASAYNATTTNDVDATAKISGFADTVTGIDDIFAAGALGTTSLDTLDLFPLLSKGNITGADFSADLPLEAPQALAFVESLTASDSNPCLTSDRIAPVVAQLLSDAGVTDTGLADPAIGDVQIYHDSGFGCDEGNGFGHFRAEVDVYIPAADTRTVTGVVVTSSNTTSLGGDGSHTLSRMEGDATSNHFVSQTGSESSNGICVTLGQSVTYTITATLSGGATVASTETRTHPRVPEAQTFFGTTAMSGNQNSPSVTPDTRPVVAWTSPEDSLATVINPPDGSAIKYSYEFSHMRINGGEPINSNGSPACSTVSSEGQLYAVDNFIPTVDCDVEACATSQGTTPDQIVCRMNIQTYLVDANDRLLGQAAGEFSFFCVDTNSDGDCGD